MNTQFVNLTISAPVSGQRQALATIDDPVFAGGMMGAGFAITPVSGQVYAPVTGKVTMVAGTRHAVGIQTPDGFEILVHLGIDTVELQGQPFQVQVATGDQVQAGQPLATMDLKAITAAKKAATVITVITNSVARHAQLFLTEKRTLEAQAPVAVCCGRLNTAPPAADHVPADLAAPIIAAIGGAANVRGVIHCMTRLRFYLKDAQQAQTATIQALPGVINVVQAGGQYQVVVGQIVDSVYDAVIDQLGSQYARAPQTVRAQTWWARLRNAASAMIAVMTAAMMPVIGILAGSGILKGILAALTGFDVLSVHSGTYLLLNAIADATFYFLPVILGVTAAKKLGSNPIVLAIVGAILIYPQLVSAAGRSATAYVTFLGIPTHLVSYTSSVFPIIVAAWLGVYVERALKRVIPLYLRSVFVPICEALILSLIIIVGLGPLITMLSQALASWILAVYNFSPALSGFLIGGFYQVMVIFGLHWGLIPIVINDLATNGHSYINAILSITMVAQGGAVLAVALKTRHQRLRELSWAAALSAFCGITEPALYGVNLKYKRVFVVASIASALGGLLTGVLRVDNYAMSGALIGFPAFITPGVGLGPNFIGYLISHYGTLLLATGFVYWFGFSDRLVDEPVPNRQPLKA